MAQPYVGEIRMFGGNFPPVGWALCNGQLLAISENDTLFTLIGTTYGGDGQETFGLPNLGGRVPVHQGQGPGLQNYQIGETAGVQEVTLTTQQIPVHTHALVASQNQGTSGNPGNQVLATGPNVQLFRSIAPALTLANNVVLPVGGSQPHTNLQPYLALTFIISLFGIFPSPT
ncbi:MAG TPA: tail fiber protein [Mycobacteriales bacterium]|jgi:microcystin-dependent protein